MSCRIAASSTTSMSGFVGEVEVESALAMESAVRRTRSTGWTRRKRC